MAKKEKTGKVIYLYLAFILPILMMITIAFSTFYYRTKNIPLQSNFFIYALIRIDQMPFCKLEVQAMLLPEKYKKPYQEMQKLRQSSLCNSSFYLYNFLQHKSTPIVLTHAKQLVDKNMMTLHAISPDGFKINYCSNPFPFWWVNDNNQICILRHHFSQSLNIKIPVNYSFEFLGWISHKG